MLVCFQPRKVEGFFYSEGGRFSGLRLLRRRHNSRRPASVTHCHPGSSISLNGPPAVTRIPPDITLHRKMPWKNSIRFCNFPSYYYYYSWQNTILVYLNVMRHMSALTVLSKGSGKSYIQWTERRTRKTRKFILTNNIYIPKRHLISLWFTKLLMTPCTTGAVILLYLLYLLYCFINAMTCSFVDRTNWYIQYPAERSKGICT
jgi:hypothetical protein